MSTDNPLSDSPTVAAIIPTLDRPEKLRRAGKSVLGQTYDNLELVVVSGGNSSETKAVVSELRADSDTTTITYVSNDEPQGLPSARNQAVGETSATYLAFLDDDDQWHPRKIERQVEEIVLTQGEDLCYTGLVSRTPEGDHVHTSTPTVDGDVYEDLLLQNVIGTPSTVLVSREAFEQVGGFDETFLYQEDWEFYIRVTREYEATSVSDPLVTRYVHSRAMSRDVEAQKLYRERLLERYSEEIQQRGLESAAWANHHRKTGITHCLNGDNESARQEFSIALAHQWSVSTVMLLLLATAGPGAFDLVVTTKRRANRVTRALS